MMVDTAACTRGQAATTFAVSGRKASDTASASRRRAAGCTAASGHRASRAATASGKVPRQAPRTRERGRPVCRTDTESSPTLMEVSNDQQ